MMLSIYLSKAMSVSIIFALIWLTLPMIFIDSVYQADNHYITTLKDTDNRVGKFVEIDRNTYIAGDAEHKLKTSYGENVKLRNLNDIQAKTGDKVSLQGKFIDHQTIYVERYHMHTKFRDIASMIGLTCVMSIWLIFIARCITGNLRIAN